MVELRSNQIEKIERMGNKKILGISSCKTMRKTLETLIAKQTKSGNTELQFYTMGILQLYNNFHPEKISPAEIEGWKGKSSFEIFQESDKIIIIKYQKQTKEEEAKEIRIEVEKAEFNTLISVIKKLSVKGEIETKEIARDYCLMLNINENDKGQALFDGNFWRNFFAWRSMHYKFTLMLNVLDKFELIEYKGEKTKLLNKDIETQWTLNLE